MLRIKVVQGVLSAEQATFARSPRTTAAASSTARRASASRSTGSGSSTSRRSSPASTRVGLTTVGACGDITRNVVGCTLAGIGHEQILDGHATAEAIHGHFLGNKLYSNLPRKYKISVTGCAEDCARGLINDVALSAAIAPGRHARLQPPRGRRALLRARASRAGSTSSSRPRRPPRSSRASPRIFRDSEENRPKRGSARLKFLLDAHRPRRPSASSSSSASAGRCGRGVAKAPGLRGHDHLGVTPQIDGEHSSVGLCVPVGRLRADQLASSAGLAARYGSRATASCGSPTSRTSCSRGSRTSASTRCSPSRSSRSSRASPTLFTRGLQTCTGKEFCGLAKVFTKERAAEIARFLDMHVRPNGHGEDLRVHFAGCSSSCAQHQIADIGIEGVLKSVDGEFVEAMDIRVGGRLGPEPHFGDVVVNKVPHWDLNETPPADLHALRDPPRRGRDLPRVRGAHRARVVGAAARRGPGARAGPGVTLLADVAAPRRGARRAARRGARRAADAGAARSRRRRR